MQSVRTTFLRHRRVRAAGVHFAASFAIAAIAAALIFVFWFPAPFSQLAGGVGLFVLLCSVDLTLGPVLTAVAAAPSKPLAELRRDIGMILLVQAVAFGYGIYAISLARPVHLVFEVDHFRVVTAANVDPTLLQDAPADLRRLPWTGPTLIAADNPHDPAERLKSIDLALAGYDLAMIPRNWRDYGDQTTIAWNAAKPLSRIVQRYPLQAAACKALAFKSGHSCEDLRFLPIISRDSDWVAVIAPPRAEVVGYLPVNGWI